MRMRAAVAAALREADRCVFFAASYTPLVVKRANRLGQAIARSPGTLTGLGIFGSGCLGGVQSPAPRPRSAATRTAFFVPYTSMLSRYCRAVSNSERMMRRSQVRVA